VSGYIVLGLLLPGVVVTWIVTGSRTFLPSERSVLGPANPGRSTTLVP
jgi:hypothetical protein